MTGKLADRPVGVSRTQSDFGETTVAYWQFGVEHAKDQANARVVRI